MVVVDAGKAEHLLPSQIILDRELPVKDCGQDIDENLPII